MDGPVLIPLYETSLKLRQFRELQQQLPLQMTSQKSTQLQEKPCIYFIAFYAKAKGAQLSSAVHWAVLPKFCDPEKTLHLPGSSRGRAGLLLAAD